MLDCQVERVVVMIHLSQDLPVCVHVHCTSKKKKETYQALSEVALFNADHVFILLYSPQQIVFFLIRSLCFQNGRADRPRAHSAKSQV